MLSQVHCILFSVFAAGFALQQRLQEISNSLSEAELNQMKSLARPKIKWTRLAKIREGFELFEELESRGEWSCTYVRELLKGIQRSDLLQKLDVPLADSAGSGKKNLFPLKVCSFL